MRIPLKFLAPALLAVSACAAPPASIDKPRDQMSQREKDSLLAVSQFIGSGVVKKALSVSDAQERRAALYDSADQ
ncbi:MAG: hypothetical protein ABI556_13655 [Gemmatimonadales bacterium]